MRTVDLREQEIFLAAIEIESAIERKDFVYQACRNHPNLRDRVQKLLDLQNGDSFILDKQVGLNTVGDITTDVEGMADLTGSTVDKYHLVRLLGSGGMGDVYLAEQKAPIRRRVAVKVIKLGLDTKNFVTRFNAERQALALMDHEGITRVFDAGSTKTGRPYFVMELVPGEPITRFCDGNRLSIRSRLEIFLLLCQAIQHAHQKGVIHRDLKPSNILASKKDGAFALKVIDFGVSKATTERVPGQTDLTRLACMIGTPEYMSPEQSDTQGNDQDIRTDVYSLGAILFELLAGSTPFEMEELKTKNLMTVREIVQTRRVEKPSARVAKLVDTKPQVFRDREVNAKQLMSLLDGNLDAVVQKCLNKDRSERYSAVAELASDLNRHLSGQTIGIVRLTWMRRSLQFFKRHKKAFYVALTLVTLLLTTSAVSLYSAIRANRFADQAIAAEVLAKQRLSEANRARREAQLAKARTTAMQEGYARDHRQMVIERITLKAIARFNKGDFVSGSPVSVDASTNGHSFQVSNWLRNQLEPSVVATLPESQPASSIAGSHYGDLLLLELLLEEQRIGLGNANEIIAETLDLLGEKRLGMDQYDQAITCLKESLFVRTDINPKSEKRIWTMILLARALQNSGAGIEAQSYIESAKRLVDRSSDHNLFREQLSELDRQLQDRQ